jgi:hypothetical protein
MDWLPGAGLALSNDGPLYEMKKAGRLLSNHLIGVIKWWIPLSSKSSSQFSARGLIKWWDALIERKRL